MTLCDLFQVGGVNDMACIIGAVSGAVCLGSGMHGRLAAGDMHGRLAAGD